MTMDIGALPDTETAFAKINLALHIRRRLDNGYHALETIFAFIGGGDILLAKPSQRLGLDISGPFAAGLSATDNLVMDAARALQSVARKIYPDMEFGADMTLEKNLPVASGIGGGSADAAAILRLLNRIWGLDMPLDDLARISAPLGADIPACVYSQTMRGEGTGIDLNPINIPQLAGSAALLVNPMISVSTAKIFANWDGVDNGPLNINTLPKLAAEGTNGLEAAAIAICPEISAIINALRNSDALLSGMSGSGATCFAIYPDSASRDAAARQISADFPDYWVMKGNIL